MIVTSKRLFAICACVMPLCMSAATADESQTCQRQLIATLQTHADSAKRPVVQVKVNGAEMAFVVNTAGVYSAISQKVATEQHLKTRDTLKPVHYMSGVDATRKDAFIPQAGLGPLAFSDVWLAEMPQAEFVSDEQGMIGGDFLHNYDVELNPAAHEISLYQKNSCGGQNVTWTEQAYVVLPMAYEKAHYNTGVGLMPRRPEWKVAVPARLNGQPVRMVIDTGSAYSVMRMGDVHQMLHGAELQQISRTGAQQKLYKFTAKELKFGNIEVQNQDIAVLPVSNTAGPGLIPQQPELILGADVIRKLHIYIANDEHKIYITSAGAH